MRRRKNKTFLKDNGFKCDVPCLNPSDHRAYFSWFGMIARVYSPHELARMPTYVGCKVCKEWRLFSNFRSWHLNNYREGFHLDKDILVPRNKVYSPARCCYVPARVNTLILTAKAIRGEYPQGVHLDRRSGRFIARCRTSDGTRHKKNLGMFGTVAEAKAAYKKGKVEVILRVAREEYAAHNIKRPVRDALFRLAKNGKF